MSEPYFKLKKKLEELGYNYSLPLEAVPLVECILADLLQTTRSLQHYMELSKEALKQRDALILETEPYKCDNAKLIQESNRLHSENVYLKEENLRLSRENKRKVKSLSEDLMKKESLISKLQHDVRDLSMRGLCAGTQSSRNKSKRKDDGDNITVRGCLHNERHLNCLDNDDNNFQAKELLAKIQGLEETNEFYRDEINLLKNQVCFRDDEITRLHILLEGGRPVKAVSRDVCPSHSNGKVQDLLEQVKVLEKANSLLKKHAAEYLEKQHEAMQRALDLADKNKSLHDELNKVDKLALSVEGDCNKRLAAMVNELNMMQAKIDSLTRTNSEMTKEDKPSPSYNKLQEEFKSVLKEKDSLNQSIKNLVELNKSLQEKILLISSKNNADSESSLRSKNCPTRDELLLLLEEERKKNEKYMSDIQEKLTETTSILNTHLIKNKDVNKEELSPKSEFIKDLHKRLCESEQKILMLKKENEDMRARNTFQEEGNKQNYKDVINHLNVENAELSKENIALTNMLSQYKSSRFAEYGAESEYSKQEILKLKDEIDRLKETIQTLRKDKDEYISRYKEAINLTDKLKRDLTYKHGEIEQLQEENNSYKMTHRTGKASADHLRDECNYLKQQIKQMQSDVIKEKTLASQIRNIQMETERSSNEIQSELLWSQKKLSQSKDTIDSLEKKCHDLQSEITTVKNDKFNLIENIKKLDKERDKLVLELDHKTESISILEQKIKTQSCQINKLENEISELKRMLNKNIVTEHKLADNEAQIIFLNRELQRLNQQYDNAVIENKHFQNSLADANGTLQLTKIEYEKSRKEVDGLKQQLQHYVTEIRRIEEMLSQKEAERSDMLEHFASLSVEANILENTNHSLESESASKSLQLQSYISKIQALEERLLDKENITDAQTSRIVAMTCRITALENEVKLVTEEKTLLEQNVSYLKQMCSNLQKDQSNMNQSKVDLEADSELKLYENRIKNLSNAKARLEAEKSDVNLNLETTEKLLSNARREIVELKLALQDATSETKTLQDRINRLSRIETETHESILTRELELPLALEETIHEVSHEEDDDSSRFHEIRKRFTKYTHGSTL